MATRNIVEIDLYNRLRGALSIREKDVEDIYREVLRAALPGSEINSPFNTDGVLKHKAHDLVALLEFKFDFRFCERSPIIDVLIQVLYYLKKFEMAGERLPSVLFVGDINECFCIHSNNIANYLDFVGVDWSLAPSVAHTANPALKAAMFDDANIAPYVFDVDSRFKFSDIVNKMLDLNDGIVRLVRVTEHNINTIFDYFCKHVVKDSATMTANQLVGMFITLLVNPKDNYMHPTKRNVLVANGAEVKVDARKYASFFSHFEKDYRPSEKARLTQISDRLLEDENRRRDGAFFTPTEWVDEAHSMLGKSLGENWRDEYVVWDCACGTGNLTRDYRFSDLYCSTKNVEEITIMEQGHISDDANARFAYDFLNNVAEDGIPSELVAALKNGKKVCFLINPPYGTANNAGTKDGDHKAGMALTDINAMMKADGIGGASQQLYAQFLYKIMKLKEIYGNENVVIALFSPTLFVTGGSYKGFRKQFMGAFHMDAGMVFQASHFADVSAEWGIMFSIWKHGTQVGPVTVDVKDNFAEFV